MSIVPLVHPLLRRLRPETAHFAVLAALAASRHAPWLAPTPVPSPLALKSTLFGPPMPNSIGIPAGFFKGFSSPELNLQVLLALFAWGLGFVELGSTSPHQRDGNPGTRHWRVPGGGAINWYGLNGPGFYTLVRSLRLFRNAGHRNVVGISLTNPPAYKGEKVEASNYLWMAQEFSQLVDFFTLNRGCPNTADEVNTTIEDFKQDLGFVLAGARNKPVYVKFGPFITQAQLDQLAQLVEIGIAMGAGGFIAANTLTFAQSAEAGVFARSAYLRQHWPAKPNEQGHMEAVGGLSGVPELYKVALGMVATIRAVNPTIRIIGVGGAKSKQHVQGFRDVGANGAQILTGFAEDSDLLGKLLAA